MAHVLILGMTESGKTTLGKSLAKEFRKKGIATAVLDPLSDPGWEEEDSAKRRKLSFVTRERGEFLATVKKSRALAVFVDEAGESVGRFETEMHWLATRGRHYGHACHFLSQRGQQIDKTVRDQCARMYLFCCSRTDAKLMADEWNKEELANSHILGKGEFFMVGRFEPLRKAKIDFPTGRVTEIPLTRGNPDDSIEGQSDESTTS